MRLVVVRMTQGEFMRPHSAVNWNTPSAMGRDLESVRFVGYGGFRRVWISSRFAGIQPKK